MPRRGYSGMRTRTFRRRYGRTARRMYRRYVRRRLTSQNKVYTFRRTCRVKPAAIVDGNPVEQATFPLTNYAAAGYFNFGHFRFRLDMLPNYTDFTNLYERYKITGIKLRFVPATGTSIDVDRPTTGSFMPTFAYAINRGAITTAADDRNFTALLENQDVQLRTAAKGFNVYIPYPKFYAPADGIVAAQEKSGWLNTKHADVDHFGLNWAWHANTTNEFLYTQFQVYATFYVKAANPQ